MPGTRPDEVDYVATTGEGELVAFRTGHFYSMTAHARGGLFLLDEARAVLDIGGSALARDPDGRPLEGACLPHDEPVRIRLRAVPREHRALSWASRLDEVGAAVAAAPTIPEHLLEHLRRARRDRRDQHGLARHHDREHPQGHPPLDGRPPGAPPDGGEGGCDRPDDRRPGR